MTPWPDMCAPRPSGRGWFWFIAAAVVFCAAVAVMVAIRAPSSTDFRDFWENAVHFRQTGRIASDRGVHNYLPFFTIFMLPWGFLPLRVAAVAFVLLSLALFALAAYLTELLLHGSAGRTPRPAFLAAIGLALPYVYACAVVGNLGLLLAFLVVATWFLVERGREWQAGVTLGLATVVKLLPGLLLLFFLLQRRWRVAAGAVATIVVLGLGLPLASLSPSQTWTEHRDFYRRAVQQHSALVTLTADKPIKAHYGNVALPMVIRRLLSPVNAASEGSGGPLYVNLAQVPPGGRVTVYAGVLLALGLVSVVVTWRGPRRWHEVSVNEVFTLRAQFGVWCCLMLLLSPLVWTHYLPLVYWPLAVATDSVLSNPRPVPLRASTVAVPVGAVGLCVWAAAIPLLAWPAARAAGAPLWAVTALWVALVSLAARRR
jgi:hypothetical protein